jgi:F-type H+-transporting ATPase subunit gamma
MKMVYASKLRKAQTALVAVRPFTRKIGAIINHLGRGAQGASAGDHRSPLQSHDFLTTREEVKKVGYVVIGADRGLCGGFNSNLHRLVDQTIRDEERPYGMIVIGRKVREYCQRRGFDIDVAYQDIGDNPNFSQGYELAHLIAKDFREGIYDEIHLIYTEFKSAMSSHPLVKQLLPVVPPPYDEEESIFAETEYIFEPSGEEILAVVVPQYVEVSIFCALQDAKASEHGARMMAMSSATDNATEMIGKLTLSLNRARQAAITKEISEIVGGAAALS